MPRFETVTDPADPRVAHYVAMRERDVTGRGGRFIAEGETVLRLLLRGSRFTPESVLIAAKRQAALAGLLATAPADLPVYVAAPAVLDAVTGFHVHRGVLAIGLRGVEPDAADLLAGLGPSALVVVAIGIANHDNVGGIFRNAAAFGADAVLLDRTSCDPLYRKAVRVSVGGSLRVPFARGGEGGGLLDLLTANGFEPLALTPGGADTLPAVRRAPRTALLLGTEGPGLPPDILARCRTVRIPMAAGFDSLNVATAGAIALHHLTG